ncbi:Uncharacterized protein HZ326_25229 [Fusarium oxysporum f. sp. albedinis]|nr:Uncharacterized protein HZ326_25229 [Fusarium oxysporum f. sp. albedinis]
MSLSCNVRKQMALDIILEPKHRSFKFSEAPTRERCWAVQRSFPHLRFRLSIPCMSGLELPGLSSQLKRKDPRTLDYPHERSHIRVPVAIQYTFGLLHYPNGCGRSLTHTSSHMTAVMMTITPGNLKKSNCQITVTPLAKG